MVEITIMKERIFAWGHAEDSAGCAAISAVLYALAGGLVNLDCCTCWEIRSGYADIVIPDLPEARSMRMMAEVGLRQIACGRNDIRILPETTADKDS